MTDQSANETTSRDRLLRAVLAATAIWAVALGFSGPLFASVPEGPNRSLWQWLILIAVAATGSSTAGLIFVVLPLLAMAAGLAGLAGGAVIGWRWGPVRTDDA